MPIEVDTVHAISPDEFRERYLMKNKPVIVTGVADQWPAFSRWTPEYLKAKGGDHVVEVGHSQNGNFTDWYLDPQSRDRRTMRFAELIDALVDSDEGRDLYMTEYDLGAVSPDLLEDVDFSDYFDPEAQPERYMPMLFLGRDTCMPLHYHGLMEAFLVQFTGAKKVWLYEPTQYSLLYPGAWHQPRPLFSRVNGRQIFDGTWDREKFPRLEKAEPIELELLPGQMLFIPVHWWHLTASSSYQVSVSHFFRSKLSCWTFPQPGLTVAAREIKLGLTLRANRLLGRSG